MKNIALKFPKVAIVIASFVVTFIYQILGDFIKSSLISDVGIAGSLRMDFEKIANDAFWINLFDRIEAFLYAGLMLVSVKLLVARASHGKRNLLKLILVSGMLSLLGVTLGLALTAPHNLSFYFYIMYLVIPAFVFLVETNSPLKGRD